MAERMQSRSRLLDMAWSKDLRFSARTLLRYPWTHGAAVLILALSLGAVLSVLSLVDELLWSPLPGIAEPERVGWLFGARGEGPVDPNRDSVTLANLLYYQEHGGSFASVGWFTGGNRVLLDKGEPDELGGFAVSGDFFRVIGTKPLLGRLIEPGDAVVGAERVVVLGEEFWRRRFGADPAVVGTSLNLNGTQYVVVGICARLFGSLGRPNSIWVAHQATAAERSDRQMQVPAFVRLKDGVTFADANRELAAASQAIALAHPETDKGMGVQALPLPGVLTRNRPLALALVSAALLVLGVAGANTANLLLAQTTERARELAIRQALGADFWTVIRQWCVQVGALMLFGIGLGTLLGGWALDAVVASMPAGLKPEALGLPGWTIGWRSWLITVAIAGGATLFIGLVPARQALRIQLGRALRDGGGGALGKARGKLTRRLLIAVQVTLASALTFGAACAYHRYADQLDQSLGFEPAGVTLLRLPSQGREADGRAQFQERLTRDVLSPRRATARGTEPESIRTQGVSLALADSPPLNRIRTQQEFYVEGAPRPDAALMPSGKRLRVSPEYFATLGIPVLSGRTFSEQDALDTPCAVAFSESLRASVFGASPAVGRRIYLATTAPRSGVEGGKAEHGADTVCDVVGVVGDVYDVVEGSSGALYFASAQWPAPDTSILLVRGADRQGLDALRRDIRRIDPAQVVGERGLAEDVEGALWGRRMIAALFAVLAGMGFTLAGIGTYAILAHTASVRRAELGLRAVLGARPRQLLWLVIADTLPVGGVGILLGFGSVAWGVTAVTGFRPEGWVYGLSVALMAALLAGSALLSARRVLGLSPALALRRR